MLTRDFHPHGARWVLAAALSLPLPALDNSIAVTDLSGGTQSARPITVSRVFAQGEVPDFAQPFIGGVPPSIWQCDRKTTWSDGSLQHALISFTATVPASSAIVVEFRNNTNPCSTGNAAACDAASLSQSGMLAFNSGAWGASIEATASGIAKSASARTMLAAGAWSYWLRGPAVTQVIVEDRTSARAYDFGWTCTASCTGNYSAATWADDLTGRSIHPIFVLTFYPGWSGVKVEYIMENAWTTALQDQRYTLTLKSGNALATTEFGPYAFTQYARTHLRKVFWDAAAPAAIKMDFNLPYMVYSKALPAYDTKLTVSTSALTAEHTTFLNSTNADSPLACTASGTRCGSYLKAFGTTGGAGDRGYLPRWFVRLLYTSDATLFSDMIAQGEMSGTVPIHYRESLSGRFFDEADLVPAIGRTVSIDARPTFRSSNLTSTSQNTADKVTPLATLSSGHNWGPDLAHQASFAYVPYLLTGDWYFLEELYFWGANNLAWSNPSLNQSGARHASWGVVADQIRGEAWALRNIAHAAFFAPDGTPEKTYFTQKAAYNLAAIEGMYNIQDGAGYSPCSTNPFNPNIETSQWCWGRNMRMRSRPDPLFLIGSGSGEVENLDTNFVRDGNSPWMQAYNVVVWRHLAELGLGFGRLHDVMVGHFIQKVKHPQSNPFIVEEYRVPVLKKIIPNPTLTGAITASTLNLPVSSLPVYFVPPFVVDLSGSSGSETIRICSVNGAALILTACSGSGLGRGFNGSSANSFPAATAVVHFPYVDSWSDIIAWTAGAATKRDMTTAADHEAGYANIAFGMLSGAPGAISAGFTGTSAYDWMLGNLRFQNLADFNPKWAFRERAQVRDLAVFAGNSQLLVFYTAPTGDPCRIATSTAPFASTADTADPFDGLGARRRQVVLEGLTSSTVYHGRITCGPSGGTARVHFTATTTAASGSANLTFRLIPPGNLAVDHAVMEYGTSASLGNSSSPQPCATGCTITLNNLPAGTVVHHRTVYRNSASQPLATGAIEKKLVQ